jgi:putative nucleotidyltransferase with HDIG domain
VSPAQTILIIDDNPNLVRGLNALLTGAGYSVQSATDGRSGLEEIQKKRPDLVLCDINMPSMNGFDLQKQLNANPDVRTLPFIFLTARSSLEDELAGIRNGAMDYIAKPFNPELLLARVQSALRRNEILDNELDCNDSQAAVRIQNLTYQLKSLEEVSNKINTDISPDDLLFQAVEIFSGYFHPMRIEFWGMDERSKKFMFKSGFHFQYSGNSPRTLDISQPLAVDPEWTSQEFMNIWTAPVTSEYSQKIMTRVYSSRHDGMIDPAYIQAFLGQISMILFKKDVLKQIKSLQEINERSLENALAGLNAVQELRDNETNNHSVRVADWTIRMCEKLGLVEPELSAIRRGAHFHDIGKIGIPDHILRKNGPLNDDERLIMQKHPLYGYDLLSKFDFLKSALNIPLYHHEQWDGGGYPYGLKGEDIPLEARIFAVVDVWDSLTHERAYRPAIAPKDAQEYITKEAGFQLQPELVYQFLQLLNEYKEGLK